jgi:hypothetical protein
MGRTGYCANYSGVAVIGDALRQLGVRADAFGVT